MSSLMQQLARYPRHIRYPSELMDHLNGSMRGIFTGYAEDPFKLRSRDIKDWFMMSSRVTRDTLTGEKMTIEYGSLKLADGAGIAAVRVTHDGRAYFFTANHLANLVPLDMLFADLNTLNAGVWVDTESGLSMMSSFGNYYQLEEAGGKCEKGTYREVVDFSSLGIRTLADLIANNYRFEYDPSRKVWVPITNQQRLLMRMRTPYYLVLRDNIIPAAEEHILAAAATDPVLAEVYAPLRGVIAELTQALTTPFDIGQRGQGVMQDPLFGFVIK